MKMKSRQEAVAMLLASGCTAVEAAQQRGIGVRTIYRWLAADPEFRRLIVQCRDQLFHEAANRITAKLADVPSKLEELTNAQSEYVRIKAIRTLADLGIRLRKDLEIEGRLQDIERQLGLAAGPTAQS